MPTANCNMPQVAILMMCYNGTAFLPDLVASLQRQTYPNWLLYVQDDLSTDDTPHYLRQLSAQDARIILLENKRKLGAMHGFMDLLTRVEAQYYMFCDQDDVWLPNKIEVTLQRMLTAEQQEGEGVPLVVHTDLTVVDRALDEMAPSFWQMSRIAPALLRTFDEQAGHNLCTGCTMLLNRAAREVSKNYSCHTLMHDAWVALCVLKHNGHIYEIDQPTILYRQHGNNTLGAHDIRTHYVTKRLKQLKKVWKENKANYVMLRDAGYGSWWKYVYYKLRYFCKYALAVNHKS